MAFLEQTVNDPDPEMAAMAKEDLQSARSVSRVRTAAGPGPDVDGCVPEGQSLALRPDWITSRAPIDRADELRRFHVLRSATDTPWRRAMLLRVSPLRTR